MNFFKKILLSFLSSPNAKDESSELTHGNPDVPLPAANFSLTSITGRIQHRPASILDSVTVSTQDAGTGKILPVGENDLGHKIVSGVNNSGAGEALGDDDSHVHTNRYGILTEGLGFESYDESLDCGDQMGMHSLWALKSTAGLSSRRTVSRGDDKRRKKTKVKDFPPNLLSLDEHGRPRFTLVKMRGNGRLMISRERNVQPRIVRARGQDGELRMKLELPQEEENEEERNVGGESQSQRGGNAGLVHLWIYQFVLVS